jgi:hypothetical protein
MNLHRNAFSIRNQVSNGARGCLPMDVEL